MAGFHPFIGSFIRAEFVRRVPAPAFDSMNQADRRAYLETHPESYTLVTRSPGDGGPDDDASPDQLIELGAEAFDRISQLGAFEDLNSPAFFLYRLTYGDLRQTGVVGLVETADYHSGTIKRHERVSAQRAEHLSRHIETLGVQSSPIAFGYRADPAIRSILDAILDRLEPSVSFTSGDGLEQAVWVIHEPDDHRALTSAFADHELYIMDGHHRAAAADALHSRVGSPRGDLMLGVLFADDRVNIEPFHRRVSLPADVDIERAFTDLSTQLNLRRDDRFATELPTGPGEVGVFMNSAWWRGQLPVPLSISPVDQIDPVRLQQSVIGPLLGVDPEHAAGHIHSWLDGGDRSRLAGSLGSREVLFVLRAVTPHEVFAVADAGLDMPPKSTYVTPKPRSGVFLRRF